MSDGEKGEKMGQVIQIDEARIKDHFGEMVRGTVEEALNAMLDAEADAWLRTRAPHSQGKHLLSADSVSEETVRILWWTR